LTSAGADVVSIQGTAPTTASAGTLIVKATTANLTHIQGTAPTTASAGKLSVEADTVAISGDTTAANNLEAMLDGTGVAGDVDITMRSLKIENDAGTGVDIDGSARGITVVGAGHGVYIEGASEALYIESSGSHAAMFVGDGANAGIYCSASGIGPGMKLVGGPTGGSGLWIQAVAGTAPGIDCFGFGSGAGARITGGTTGHGLHLKGGITSGDGLHVEAQTLGDGIEAAGAGGGFDINADIHGTLDTVTTCSDQRGTDNAALAATALSNVQWTDARAGYLDELAAANMPADLDAVLADTGTDGVLLANEAITAAVLAPASIEAGAFAVDAMSRITANVVDGLKVSTGWEIGNTLTFATVIRRIYAADWCKFTRTAAGVAKYYDSDGTTVLGTFSSTPTAWIPE